MLVILNYELVVATHFLTFLCLGNASFVILHFGLVGCCIKILLSEAGQPVFKIFREKSFTKLIESKEMALLWEILDSYRTMYCAEGIEIAIIIKATVAPIGFGKS